MELGERVTKLEVGQARLEERVDGLEEYKAKQNGSIQQMQEQLNGMNRLLVGLLGGVITSLILLLVNISLGR